MTLKNFIYRFAVAFITLHLVMIYAPISTRGVLLALVLSAAMLLMGHRNGLLLVASLVALTLLLEVLVRFSGGIVMTPYYRAHEILAEETRYRANERVEMVEPHGDLLATDPSLNRSLAQPRTVIFQTDSRGFRNDNELSSDQLVIVGDSYVVGIGNTQSDTIASQLQDNHGIPAYSMSFPAGPFQYANNVQAARAELGEAACVVVMMSEGNDFQWIDRSEQMVRNAISRSGQLLVKRYFGLIKKPFEVSRVVFGLFTRSIERTRQLVGSDNGTGAASKNDVTIVKIVAGSPMVFLKGYTEVVQRGKYSDFDYIQDQFTRGTPDLFVFVPEKYRVYGQFVDDESPDAFPQAQLEHVSRVAGKLGVPVLDLTQPLVDGSRDLLDKGRLTWWRDDTHWNRFGIEIAAREIARALPSLQSQSCKRFVSSEG